jgi:hypothetical protein
MSAPRPSVFVRTQKKIFGAGKQLCGRSADNTPVSSLNRKHCGSLPLRQRGLIPHLVRHPLPRWRAGSLPRSTTRDAAGGAARHARAFAEKLSCLACFGTRCAGALFERPAAFRGAELLLTAFRQAQQMVPAWDNQCPRARPPGESLAPWHPGAVGTCKAWSCEVRTKVWQRLLSGPRAARGARCRLRRRRPAIRLAARTAGRSRARSWCRLCSGPVLAPDRRGERVFSLPRQWSASPG